MTEVPELSIIILNYNTKDLLVSCLRSLANVVNEVPFEVIVADNGSSDGSVETIKELRNLDFRLKVKQNHENLGFARGNNEARDLCLGKYVLFLNSDTEMREKTLSETVNYLKTHKDVGVVTCKQVLPSGKIDPDSRRSFPTPWVAITHFLYLDRIFPHSRIFAKYWYGYKSSDEISEIDVCQGAYFLTRKRILDEVGWFSEDYFLDGEDIDLSWKIKSEGYKIIYYPKVEILHLKKATKKLSKASTYTRAGVDSMEIFYRKHLWQKYPSLVNHLVITGIRLVKLIRLLRRLMG